MDFFWGFVMLVAALLLFLEVKRLLKVIAVCRLNEINCTGSYLQAAAMFLVSALLILASYADLTEEPQRWSPAPPTRPAPESWSQADNSSPHHPTLMREAGFTSLDARTRAVVARVIDGDTILLTNGDRVTYTGIDAPEIAHPRKPVEPLGREAYRLNRLLVEGKQVERDVANQVRDSYGRLAAYVFAGDVFVNAELVRKGLAQLAPSRAAEKYAPLLAEAAREARHHSRGLWAMQ